MDTLVSTEWLEHNLGEPDLAIVDSSAFMPNDGRDGRAEFLNAHIGPIPRLTCFLRPPSSGVR